VLFSFSSFSSHFFLTTNKQAIKLWDNTKKKNKIFFYFNKIVKKNVFLKEREKKLAAKQN